MIQFYSSSFKHFMDVQTNDKFMKLLFYKFN